jgi:DNA-binding NtrC family response regulator
MKDSSVIRVLVVEDDQKMRTALQTILEKEGYKADTAETGEGGLIKMRDKTYDLVITDLKLPGIDGMDVLKGVRKVRPETAVIMITAYATIDSAVEAMKEGAEDYIAKPFNLEEIRIVIRKALEKQKLISDNRGLREQLRNKYRFDTLIGQSEAMVEVFKMISKVKDSKATVLILGETGTGKELVARAIHFNSIRVDKPFLAVNCGALTESLLESELFGHVKGAFTGALRDKKGVFEAADGGTVFLDEVGDVSIGLQQVLLRVLESGEIQPVGSTRRNRVDVRVIAATNKDLNEMICKNIFREDLFYRLNVISIRLPPLRERREDIATLAHHFLRKHSQENNKDIDKISTSALAILEAYQWPGNVRELDNTIARAVLLESEKIISPASLPDTLRNAKKDVMMVDDDETNRTLEEVGKAHIIKVLEKTGGNKVKASELLGINRTSLWRMMQRLNIKE